MYSNVSTKLEKLKHFVTEPEPVHIQATPDSPGSRFSPVTGTTDAKPEIAFPIVFQAISPGESTNTAEAIHNYPICSSSVLSRPSETSLAVSDDVFVPQPPAIAAAPVLPVEEEEALDPIAWLKMQYADIKSQSEPMTFPPKNGYYENCETLGRRLYELTLNFLDENQHVLSPEEKGQILIDYVRLWSDAGCILNISETGYAKLYEGQVFTKYSNSYSKSVPMMAGFNLKGAIFNLLYMCDMHFLSVNFEGANFSNAKFPYAHFENCNLSGIQTNIRTDFNQSRFEKCDMESADLSQTVLCEVQFYDCYIFKAKINSKDKPEMVNCITEKQFEASQNVPVSDTKSAHEQASDKGKKAGKSLRFSFFTGMPRDVSDEQMADSAFGKKNLSSIG